MSFDDVRLPVYVERGARGGGRFKTQIVSLSSGYEKRNRQWSKARMRWDIGYGIQDQDDYEDIIEFFYARQGMYQGFRFKDWTDFRVGTTSNPQTIGTGDNSETSFKAIKTYASGTSTYSRRLFKLVSGSISMYLDSVLQDPADYSVDVDTGTITFLAAPAKSVDVGIVAEFDVPVRFDTDELDLEVDLEDAASVPSIPVVELKLQES